MTTTLAPHGSGNRTGLSSIFSIDQLSSLRKEFDQMLSNWFTDREGGTFPSYAPSLDLTESDENYEIKADLPGVKANEIKVQLSDNVLTISGERKYEKTKGHEKGKKNGLTPHFTERFHGTFARSVSLPGSVKSDEVDAQYHDGVLTVIVPKAENSKTCQIPVKS